jgi:hypothetical protein
MPRPLARALVLMAGLGLSCRCALGAGIEITSRSPEALTARVIGAQPGKLYRVTYNDGKHFFIWENLAPEASGTVRLADDRHLRPEYRLRCESRVSRGDPVVFDDLLKGPILGRRRLQHGVPVSSFGGAGYLVPGLSDLRRDDFGNFWLFLDHPPYAVLKYDSGFAYQFALLTPDRILAHDSDSEGNLYLLHPGNWISKHGPLGERLGAWELPIGREPGEFISASGLVVDRAGGFLYVADEALGRVQRFDLDLRPQPFPHTPWGWIGREDLAFTCPGKYDADTMYYQLDRPRQLRLDGQGHLLVSCEHYISKFDLATGRQLPFGANPVLGWGGTFSDSAFSASAGLNGHWQRQWLAGVDGAGRIYVADRDNEFVVSPRLQIFSPEGVLLRVLGIDEEVRDRSGQRVYITAVAGLASAGDGLWLVDAAGRIYESDAKAGLGSGGRLHLGPGAAGRQFDLSRVEASKFAIEEQAARVLHRVEGLVLGLPGGERGTGNCEREGRPELANGERSLWMVTRLGEPFHVTLYDEEGKEIPASQYSIEVEEKPGLFGSLYDYFRVTNQSGATWRSVRFVAEAIG